MTFAGEVAPGSNASAHLQLSFSWNAIPSAITCTMSGDGECGGVTAGSSWLSQAITENGAFSGTLTVTWPNSLAVGTNETVRAHYEDDIGPLDRKIGFTVVDATSSPTPTATGTATTPGTETATIAATATTTGTATVPATAPQVYFSKSAADDTIAPGQEMSFRIRMQMISTGQPGQFWVMTINDAVPAIYQSDYWYCTGHNVTCSQPFGTGNAISITGTVVDSAQNADVLVFVHATVASNAANGADASNTACGTLRGGAAVVADAVASLCDTAPVSITRTTWYSVEKTASSPVTAPGEVQHFTIVVSIPDGTDPGNVFSITDIVPTIYENVSWTCGGYHAACAQASGTGNAIHINGATTSDETTVSLTIEVTATVIGNAIGGADASNTACAKLAANDDDETDGLCSTASVVVSPVWIMKTASVSEAAPGDTVTFTIQVTNPGASFSFIDTPADASVYEDVHYTCVGINYICNPSGHGWPGVYGVLIDPGQPASMTLVVTTRVAADAAPGADGSNAFCLSRDEIPAAGDGGPVCDTAVVTIVDVTPTAIATETATVTSTAAMTATETQVPTTSPVPITTETAAPTDTPTNIQTPVPTSTASATQTSTPTIDPCDLIGAMMLAADDPGSCITPSATLATINTPPGTATASMPSHATTRTPAPVAGLPNTGTGPSTPSGGSSLPMALGIAAVMLFLGGIASVGGMHHRRKSPARE